MFQILVLLAFLLPFQVALNPVSGVDLASSRLVVVLLFLFWMLKSLKEKKIIISGGILSGFLLSFLGLVFLSLFEAQNMAWGVRKLAFLFSVFPIFWVAGAEIKKTEEIIKTAKAFVWGSFAVAILGIGQFFAQFVFGLEKVYFFWAKNLAPLFLGNAFSEAVLKNPSWLVNVSGKTLLRATGTFPDPHMLAFFLNLAIFTCLGLLFSQRKRKVLYIFIFFVLIIANLLTFSRGGYLGMVVAFAVLLGIFWNKIKKSYRWSILGLGLIFISGLLLWTPVAQRFASSFDFSEGSNIGRLGIWKEALGVISEHPWGVGIGNYSLAVKPLADYRDPIYAHNAYLDIVAESGIPAGFFWIAFLVFAFWKFKKKTQKEPFFLGISLAIVAFSVHSLVETPIYSPVVMIAFLLLVSFLKNEKNEKNT